MVKVVTLFLIVFAVLALARGLLRSRKVSRPARRGDMGTFRKCPECGKYRLVGSVCACGTRG